MKKSEQTKQKIIDFFVHQMQKKDYDKITVKEISEGLQIQRSTFYQYFDNCGVLVTELEEQILEGMCFYRRSAGRMAHDLTPLPSVEEWFRYCIQYKKELLALWGPHGDRKFEERFRQKVCTDMNRMMDDEGMPKDGLRPYCVELNFSIHFSLLRFALQTAGTELEMPPAKLAGLANNWRAAAILAEKKQGIPTTEEEFQQLYPQGTPLCHAEELHTHKKDQQ